MSALRRSKPETDQLAGLPLFSNCSTAQLSKVASAGQIVTVPANWAVISEGTPGDACYIILSGGVRVAAQGKHLADLEAGEVIGEAGLLSNRLRNATVSTTAPSVLLHIDSADFEKLLNDVPPLREEIEAAAARRKAAKTAEN